MKIGLLTYYGDLNCGTNLQAYATLLAIRKAYPDDEVEIIPFHGFRARMMPYKTFSPVNIYHDIIRFKKYADFKRDKLCVIHDHTITEVAKALEFIASRKYDVIYVGADTLLELDRLPKGYDGISTYWLKDIKAKKILIAASSKNVDFDKLSKKQKEDLKIAANQFSHIGLRDRATLNLFNHLLEDYNRIKYVPDPTFTFDIDYSYIEKYLAQHNIHIPRKSVFIQFFGNDIWLNDAVAKLKRENYTIVTSRGISWSDIVLIDMSPLEQIGLYRYVDFVITHRFHDGVFSLKNHTPFLIYIKSTNEMIVNGESKHISLLKSFEIYPQAYLGECDSKKGLDDVLSRYKKLKDVFNESKIDDILQRNKMDYINFLESTKDK
ncbi:polysaccharide pyruvyl transferase family protein [Bacteroides gallinaceum]|uniref:polysaccharide pyruvyl transferase family protein n=1 Tax=Bacteroides gallinaceum TaxID=1462571 RepID=UPI0025A4766F|nr:polysaccharide pyruvyl transferase family protein [Bacteroides gallinaceum]MDM8154887.1 polysaccharide pyruvyl transferase family protein [Bacteroides gallinaceum]